MTTIKQWLAEENTFLNYYVEDKHGSGIDFDIVPDEVMQDLINWTLLGEDAGERVLEIIEFADTATAGEWIIKLMRGDLKGASECAHSLTHVVKDWIMYTCDMNKEICEDGLREYGRQYARDAIADSKLQEYHYA
jgi:hypothetical protein